jgi:hypothetical protein
VNAENEARTPATDAPRMMPPGGECPKEMRPRDVSYIDHNPDKQVVLSPRLEELARRIGGCQTEEVLALVRRIMFEVISQRKGY